MLSPFLSIWPGRCPIHEPEYGTKTWWLNLRSKSSLSAFTASLIAISGRRYVLTLEILPLKSNSKIRTPTKNHPIALCSDSSSQNFMKSLLSPLNNYVINRLSVGKKTMYVLYHATDTV